MTEKEIKQNEVDVEVADTKKSGKSEKDPDNMETEKAPRRIFEINTVFDKENQERSFLTNIISTTKYTCVNFLPKNLYE